MAGPGYPMRRYLSRRSPQGQDGKACSPPSLLRTAARPRWPREQPGTLFLCLPRVDRRRYFAPGKKSCPVGGQTLPSCTYPGRGSVMSAEASHSGELLRRAAAGDQQAVNELFTLYRDRLRAMVRLRLNRRLQGRVDPSDVLQEAYLEVCKGLADYLQSPSLPFFLWLRHVTGQKLITVHRQHLGAQMRDADREISLYRGALPQASSASLAAQL